MVGAEALAQTEARVLVRLLLFHRNVVEGIFMNGETYAALARATYSTVRARTQTRRKAENYIMARNHTNDMVEKETPDENGKKNQLAKA